MNIWVIGIPGTGKSAVFKELLGRGFDAYGVDEDGFQTLAPDGLDWKLDEGRIGSLRRGRGTAFLCGSEGKLCYRHLFDRIFALEVDWLTTLERLRSRPYGWGKKPEELASIKRDFDRRDKLYADLDATRVDARRPVPQIVDEIIAALGI